MTLKKITGKDIKEAVDWLWEHKQDGGCIHQVLGTTDDGTKLCFVVGWAEGRDYGDDDKKYGYFDEGYCISAKIGYQHRNNAMQTDYDWDFNMPYDLETGDVWDTSSYVPRDADWEREAADYNKEASAIWRKYGKPNRDGMTALDLMESKKKEAKKHTCSMQKKKESLAKKNEAYSDYDAIQDWLEGVMGKAGTMFESTDVSENRPGEICAEIYGYDSTGGDATFTLVWQAGEDFAETISAMADELVEYAEDFDPEEEAEMYRNSGLAGVPSLRQLLKAMDERKEDMVSLAGAVSLAASKL